MNCEKNSVTCEGYPEKMKWLSEKDEGGGVVQTCTWKTTAGNSALFGREDEPEEALEATTDTIEGLDIPKDMTFKAHDECVTAMPANLSSNFSRDALSTSVLVPQATSSKMENQTEVLPSVNYDESLENRPTFSWTPILLMPTNTAPPTIREPHLAQDISSTRPRRESVGEAAERTGWMHGPGGVGAFDNRDSREIPKTMKLQLERERIRDPEEEVTPLENRIRRLETELTSISNRLQSPSTIRPPPSDGSASGYFDDTPLIRFEDSLNRTRMSTVRQENRKPADGSTAKGNMRRPGPAQDGLNKWARKHILGISIDSLPSNSMLRTEAAHLSFSDKLASLAKRPDNGTASGTQTPSSNKGGIGFENAAAAIAEWVRRLAIKASRTPKGGGSIEAPDLIDLLDEGAITRCRSDVEVKTPLPPQPASNADGNEDTDTDCHQREFQNSPEVTRTNNMIDDVTRSMDGEESTTESYNSESEPGSNNSAYLDLCKAERGGDSLPKIIEPFLDPMRQALVDRIMEEFWVLFDQEWDTGFVKEAAGVSPPSGSGSSNGSTTSANSMIFLPIQRKRQREKEDPQRNGMGETLANQAVLSG
jgi:hypothetical protein